MTETDARRKVDKDRGLRTGLKFLRRIPRGIYLLLWAGAIILASFLPQGSTAARACAFQGHAFAAHIVAYGVLSLLTFWTTETRSRVFQRVTMVVGPAAFGLLLEALQPLSGRKFGVVDLLANGFGIALAFSAVMGVYIVCEIVRVQQHGA